MATTQNKRRLTFGLNVFIGVSAALALAVLACWFTFRYPKRYDFTHTRQYSLSAQTLAVLNKNLTEPHEIVTLFARPTADTPGRGEQIERARDLIDEYVRRSNNLKAEHISLSDFDPAKANSLYERIRKRYATRLEPVINAVSQGNEAVKTMKDAFKRVSPLMLKLSQDPELKNRELKECIQGAAQAFAGVDAGLERAINPVASEATKPLPNYGGSLNVLRTTISKLDTDLLAVVSAQLKLPSVAEGNSVGIQEQRLQILDAIDNIRKPAQQALANLRSVNAVADYEKLRDQLAVPDTILVMGPERETVVQLDEMYRQVDNNEREAMSKEGVPELAFLGEERLTGALLSLSMKVRPKIVFVYAGRRPAIGAGGLYNNVASRLSKLSFVVEQWTPGPRQGPMGQPMPPSPPPSAEPGQKVVWVLLPTEPADERNPMAGRIGEQAISVVMEKLNSGDSGMMILAPSPTARVNPTSPLVQGLEVYKLKPLVDRVVLREFTGKKSGEKEASNRLDVNTWPDTLPVTKAIGGLPGVFLQGVPIESTAEKTGDVKTWPLVVVTQPGLWAEQELTNFASVKRKPEMSADSFTLAMASETKTNRVIVVGDPVWASDEITGMGILGPNSADIAGAAFPANTELFVNSMYWLAHLEDLIAASPRSQDIRRIEQMSAGTYRGVYWGLMAGLPIAAVFMGVSVYLLRQRV